MSDQVGFLEASEEEQLDRVRTWHRGGGYGKHLYEFLGLTQEEYCAWVEDPNSDNPLRSDLHYSDGIPADLFALADAKRFQRMAQSMDHDWTLEEAFKNWEEYSHDMNAGWMTMPERPADIWITWLKYQGRKKYQEKYLKLGEPESVVTQEERRGKFKINEAGDVELPLDGDRVLIINAGDEGICLDVWEGNGEESCWSFHAMYDDMLQPEPEPEKSDCIWPHYVDGPIVVYDRVSYDRYLSGEYSVPSRCLLCGSEIRYSHPLAIVLSLNGRPFCRSWSP
jgi:hypothetical protein